MTEERHAEGAAEGRKGGTAGNGASRDKQRIVPVPFEFFLNLCRIHGDEAKLLMWLLYRAEVAPGRGQQVREIAQATGLGEELTELLLRDLRNKTWAVYDACGFRLADDITAEQWTKKP